MTAAARADEAQRRVLRCLLLEDMDSDADLVEITLRRHGFDPAVTRARSGNEFRAALLQPHDIIIMDFSLPQYDAFHALADVRDSGVDIPILVVTGTLDDEGAVRCIREGASDYLLKDRLARLGAAVDRALDEHRLRLEQAHLAERERRQVERLNALRLIDVAITGSLDVTLTLNVVLEQVTHILEVDAASVLLLDRHSGELVYARGRGFRSTGVESTALALGEGLAGRAAQERRTIFVQDLEAAEGLPRTAAMQDEGFRSYHAVPLVAKGVTRGVLELYHRTVFTPEPEWTEFVNSLAAPAAIALDNAQLVSDMQRANIELELAYDRTLEGWARTLELRDYETRGHSDRVVALSRAIGRAAGFDGPMMADLKRGALLHDVGKIAIPDSVLLKPGPLIDAEWEVMRMHPVYGYRLLADIPYLSEAVKVAHSHHEKWDGSGYPLGLKGDEIPILARAFSIADVYDALRSERPYKHAWPRDEVLAYIKDQSGVMFDPAMVALIDRIPSEALP